MERRELFKIIAAGALSEAATAARKPFFDPTQTAALDALSDIILPTDDQSPGAHEAKVVRFLDLLATHAPPERQQQWRKGIEAVEAESKARFNRPFTKCARADQEQIVASMAAHEGDPRNDIEHFFEILKPAVVDGYRFSEIGVKRYMRWVGNGNET